VVVAEVAADSQEGQDAVPRKGSGMSRHSEIEEIAEIVGIDVAIAEVKGISERVRVEEVMNGARKEPRVADGRGEGTVIYEKMEWGIWDAVQDPIEAIFEDGGKWSKLERDFGRGNRHFG
jgi:hypothetical protein